MLTPESSLALQAVGVVWSPTKGDQFFVPDRDLDDQVFVVSDMVIDVVEVPYTAPMLAFNGTTEWALDSFDSTEAVWIPREDQLRDLLGDTFLTLERLEGPTSGYSGYAVTIDVGDGHERHVDVSAEAAYARALVALLGP